MKERILKATNHPYLGNLIRFGFVIRGILYLFIGIYGLGAVIGWQEGVKNSSDIIKTLNEIPFGKEVLIIVFTGLFGYGLWGVVRAVMDTLDKGNSASGLVIRIGYLISGITYIGLSLLTLQIFMNLNVSDDSGYQSMARAVSRFPAGYWIVGGIGLVIILAGCNLVIYAFKEGFRKIFPAGKLAGKRRKIVLWSGKYGYAIQGVLYIFSGLYLVRSGIVHDITRTLGPVEILSEVIWLPGGPAIVGIASCGIMAYGIYSIFSARLVKVKST